MIDLKSVVEKYPECLDSATKFKSYMMDLYPDNSNKACIRILADIIDCGIALEIKNGKTDNISISNFCNTMESQYGYSAKLVGECINQFLVAFGYSINSAKYESSFNLEQNNNSEVCYICNVDDFEIVDDVLKKYHGGEEYVAIPDCVREISFSAFKNCESLVKIKIPDGVTSIGMGAFSDCENLTSVIIPNSVTSIVGGAFEGCKSLKFIEIPDGMTSIFPMLFAGCSSLTSITIPDGVTNIGFCAFKNCENLTSIIIPNSVTSIGEEAFFGCNNVTAYCYSEEKKNFVKRFFKNVQLIKKGNTEDKYE